MGLGATLLLHGAAEALAWIWIYLEGLSDLDFATWPYSADGAVRFRIGDGVGSPVRYRDETARYWNAR